MQGEPQSYTPRDRGTLLYTYTAIFEESKKRYAQKPSDAYCHAFIDHYARFVAAEQPQNSCRLIN